MKSLPTCLSRGACCVTSDQSMIRSGTFGVRAVVPGCASLGLGKSQSANRGFFDLIALPIVRYTYTSLLDAPVHDHLSPSRCQRSFGTGNYTPKDNM
jgi:hypothetical protein